MGTPSPWDDFRRKSLIFYLLVALFFPVMLITGLLAGNSRAGQVLFMVVGCFWMLIVSYVGNVRMSFPCPRCGKSFFRTKWGHWGFGRRCLHCGLPKWAELARDASTA